MCKIFSGLMADTKSNKSRSWIYRADSLPSHPCGAGGVLSISQGQRTDVYDVEADLHELSVFLCKRSDGEVYAVEFDAMGKQQRCTCIGYSTSKGCKHFDAVKALASVRLV